LAKHDQAYSKPEFSIVPKGATESVVVFHEVWGLVSHTQDVCKRLGKLGFAAIAPNLYEGYGDVLNPEDIQSAMEAVWELSLEERRDRTKVAQTLTKKGATAKVREVVSIIYDQAFRDKMLADAVSAIEETSKKFDRVSALGFCIGGGLALKTAAKSRHLTSVVSFYGAPPAIEDVKKIDIPLLTIYATQDEIINEMVPAFVREALTSGKDLTLKIYPGTKHGFFNDTRKDVYDRKSAIESWDLTKWFLERKLGKN
jgi:carboxymethylenebutenolidase